MYKEEYKNWVLQIMPNPSDLKTLLLSAENKELGIRYFDKRNVYQEKITHMETHTNLFGSKTTTTHHTNYLIEETLKDAIRDLKAIVESACIIEQQLRKNIKQFEIKINYGKYESGVK